MGYGMLIISPVISIPLAEIEFTMIRAGIPARAIKKVDDKTKSKTELVEALRNL